MDSMGCNYEILDKSTIAGELLDLLNKDIK